MSHNLLPKLFFLFIFMSSLSLSFAQKDSTRYTASNKGKFFLSWGGNRADYSKSDIRFKGENYDFTIKDASAKDLPKGWHIDYIKPNALTTSQTNFKLSYFISDHYYISIGEDHMKYVMHRNRDRTVNGFINLPANEAGSIYNGVFDNETLFISEDLLKFEHTNGLNYVFVEFGRSDDISSIFNINNTDVFQLNITEGFGAGVLYPKTNTTLLGKEQYDEFHVSGYGLSLNVGLNFTFFKHFFIQLDAKGGFIDMPDIRTTSNSNEYAQQHFFFFQRIVSFGGIFRL